VSPLVYVAPWIWTTTTVFGGISACALLVILGVELFVAATFDDEQLAAYAEARRRRRRVAILFGLCFAAIVGARFALILVQRGH
jgi:hypothetical protein